jgi:hypothetical protein
VTAHIRRIEAVEKDLAALAAGVAHTEDLSRVRAEVKKLYDGLHVGPSRPFSRSPRHADRLARRRVPRPPHARLGHS